MPSNSSPNRLDAAYFAGGCFWCTEAVFTSLTGVVSVTPGYAGGHTPDPTYDMVSTGTTGHAETIKINFDPAKISYATLLEIFLATHDPTTLNRQGADVGTQYRSAIFYASTTQRQAALNQVHPPMVTEITPLDRFYPAENYHQDYYRRHQNAPYCQLVINPKLQKLRQHYTSLLSGSFDQG